MTDEQKKKWKQGIAAVLLVIAAIIGVNVSDLTGDTDITPYTNEISALQTEVASEKLEKIGVMSENVDLTVDNNALGTQVANNDVVVAQLNDHIATQAARIAELENIPVVTATVAPTSTPIPKPAYQVVRVSADKVISFTTKADNKAGYPIMTPEKLGDRMKWVKGEVIKILPGTIRADGDNYFYELYDHPGKYVDADKVVVQ